MSFDKISDALEIANETDLELKDAVIEIQKETDTDVQSDYELSRSTYRALIQSGQTALENLQTVAGESDSPYAYQMISALMKSITDTTEKLMKLQKMKRELEAEKPGSSGSGVTNNNLFFGTTSELKKFLAERKKNEQ